MDELKQKYVGKFLGPNSITDIAITEQKTPKGDHVFLVTFGSGSTTIVTEKTLGVSAVEKAEDFGAQLDHKLNAIIPEIVAVLEEYDIASIEVNTLVSRIKANIDMRFNRAINFLFLGDDKRFIPGWSHENDVTLLMSEKVIASIPKEDVV